ncbi:MAG: hypothetical protein HLUCCO16_04715 [Phormidium sp. OSCR]|nr:MAG: hypothetical protein HLUCCO16_04715 [Phormidium sp. OSCR]
MSYLDREWVVFGPEIGYSVNENSVKGLYLIYCDDPNSVKIGISAQPLARISNLNTGSPSQLHLFFYSKLLGTVAENKLHAALAEYRRGGEWFNWSPEVQGFLLGLIFGISGVIQVSWPFAAAANSSMFIAGVNWIHKYLDPDEKWTLQPMTVIGGEKALELFQDWNNFVLESRNKSTQKKAHSKIGSFGD